MIEIFSVRGQLVQVIEVSHAAVELVSCMFSLNVGLYGSQ